MKIINRSFLLGLCLFMTHYTHAQFVDTPEYNAIEQSQSNFASIAHKIVYQGNQLPMGSEVAAFETIEGNMVGAAEVFFNQQGESVLFFTIFGTASPGGRTQLAQGSCFRLQIWLAGTGATDFIDVVHPSHPLAGCGEAAAVGAEPINVNIGSSNNSQRMEPMGSQFGTFVSSTGGFLSGWEGGGQPALLPVTYSSISLTNNKCNSVSFDWATESEINNEGFYVERKSDGERGWTELGFVEGNGTTAREEEYSYTDTEVVKDKSLKNVYYRLKQVDYDGRIEYSNVKSIRLNCGNESFINVFPNPITNFSQITIHHEDLRDDEVAFKVYSINGQLVDSFTRKTSDKDNVEFNTSDYPTGLFRIQAITNNQIIAHTKFVKN